MKLVNFSEDSGWRCESPVGNDYTLCGDGWTGETICHPDDVLDKNGKRKDITCKKCLTIIQFCRDMK